jgi:hypothetical protein
MTVTQGVSERHELPDDLLPPGDLAWHPATLRWWNRWCDSPLATRLPEVDWSELEATAVLHHEYMRKRTFTLASELRLRMQKFGATPEDRMRLRILVADADDKDGGGRPELAATGTSARERFSSRMVTLPVVGR